MKKRLKKFDETSNNAAKGLVVAIFFLLFLFFLFMITPWIGLGVNYTEQEINSFYFYNKIISYMLILSIIVFSLQKQIDKFIVNFFYYIVIFTAFFWFLYCLF
jgi:uncharacterized membrane protein